MKNNRLIAIILAFSMLAILLTGCGKMGSSGKTAATEAPSGAPATFSQTITIVDGANPGSSIDTYAKEFAAVAAKYTDQTILIENKPGGSNSVALNYVQTKPADGYTALLAGSSFEVKTGIGDYPNFTGEDYNCVGILHSEQFMVVVKADSQFNTMQDIIDYCKANPGKLNVGSSGSMSQMNLFALQLMDAADIDFDYVPYDDVSEYMLALLGGNIDVVLAAVNAAEPYVESKQVKIIAQGLEKRSENYPDIPTVFETKGLELDKFGNVGLYTFRSFKVLSDTPDSMKQAWVDLIEKVNADPDWIEFSKNMGVDMSSFCTGEKADETSHKFVDLYKSIYDSYQASKQAAEKG